MSGQGPQRADLILTHEPGIAGYVSSQDGRQPAFDPHSVRFHRGAPLTGKTVKRLAPNRRTAKETAEAALRPSTRTGGHPSKASFDPADYAMLPCPVV
jgi:hypothetical protein